VNSALPRVLIVDDRLDSVALLLAYLKGQAIDVMVATDGQDALRKAVAGAPQAILLDVAMPGMDGYAVCRQLKAEPLTAAVPVLFLSAMASVEERLQGYAAGGADFIGKPFSAEEVLTRLFVHLRMARQLKLAHAQAVPVAQAGLAAARAPAGPQTLLAPRDNELVDAALAVLQREDSAWPGSEALARSLGTNEKKLTELFRLRFGLTVYEYLVQQRLETARARLATTLEQIQLVADRAGYRNASDFSRAFRSRYGVGPRQYRHSSQGMALPPDLGTDTGTDLPPDLAADAVPH
jgi:CheY-like chemotaxis protein